MTATLPAAPISAALTAKADDLAHRIRDFQQRTVLEALEIGRDLIDLKSGIGHGNFGAWLEHEIPHKSRTTILNWMRSAERFEHKFATVAKLPAALVYRLAAKSVPAEIRDGVIAKIEAGEIPDPESVDHDLAVARQEREKATKAAKRARDRAEMTKDQLRAADRREAREEAFKAEREATVMRRQEAAERIAGILASRLGDDLHEVVALMGRDIWITDIVAALTARITPEPHVIEGKVVH